MLNILVIEDHSLVREGLVHLLRRLSDDVVIHEAAEGEAGVHVLEANDDIDLVLLDLALPGVDGLTWLRIQRKRFPAVPIVVCSAYDDAATVGKVMQAGAAGFVPKAYPADRLLLALQRVLEGYVVTPNDMAQGPLAVDRPDNASGQDPELPVGAGRIKDPGLSPRQIEVLSLMVKGRSNREIAELLGLTEGTVKIHISAIFRALEVKSRTQALIAVGRLKLRFD